MHKLCCFSLILLLGLLVTSSGQEKEPVKEPAKKEIARKQIKVFRLQLCEAEEVMTVLHGLLELDEMEPPAPGMPMPPPVPRWHVTAEPRTGLVFVRGRAEDVQLATEVISVLESPTGKPLPKTELIRAFKLSHASLEEIERLTDDLELPIRMIALDSLKIMIAAGPADALADWTSLVKEADMPTRKLDENKRRRLGVVGGGGAMVY